MDAADTHGVVGRVVEFDGALGLITFVTALGIGAQPPVENKMQNEDEMTARESPYTPDMIDPIKAYDAHFMLSAKALDEYHKVLWLLTARGQISDETPGEVLDCLDRAFMDGGGLMAHAMRLSYHDDNDIENEWHGGLDAIPTIGQVETDDDLTAVRQLLRNDVWELGLGLSTFTVDLAQNLATYDVRFLVANRLHGAFAELFYRQSEETTFITDTDDEMVELIMTVYTAGALFMANAARTSFHINEDNMWDDDFETAARKGRVLLDAIL